MPTLARNPNRPGAGAVQIPDESAALRQRFKRAPPRGESFLQPSITAKVLAELGRLEPQEHPPPTLPEPLSGRELEILAQVAAGLSNKQIAERLHLAGGTVKKKCEKNLIPVWASYPRRGHTLRG